jgi:predicted peptidase
MKRRLLGLATAALALIPNGSCRRPKVGVPSQQVLALAARMEAHVYRDSAATATLPYRLYSPPGLRVGERYPLLVYLHGGGSGGNDNLNQLGDANVARFLAPDVQAFGPFFVLVPQCPPGDEWINRHATPPFHTYDQAKFPESVGSKSTAAIIAELARSRPIDPDRVYLTGASMGGSGTWDFITRRPGIVAAAIPVTGVSDPSRAAVIADLPIWAFHGTRDEISPVENARAMRRALEAVGGKARFSELEGVGHDSWTHAYGQPETFVWLFAQRRSSK